MKICFNASLVAAACLISSAASAGTPSYTSLSVITSINVREAAIDIYLPQANNPMGCATGNWVRVNSSTANYNAIASFIISQYAAHKAVRLFVSNCDTDGTPLGVAAGGDF